MNKVEEIVDLIRERTAMYIGRESIFCLNAFLLGFFMEKRDHADLSLLAEFQDWVQAKYRIKSTQSWASIIHFFSSNEVDALYNFFKDFDEFLEGRKRVDFD